MTEVKASPKKKVREQFKITKENSKIPKSIIETLSALIEETQLIVTPEGFHIKAMDPSKACMISLFIEKENFDEFECREPCKLSLNLEDFDKILRRSTTNDQLVLSYKEEEQRIKVQIIPEESMYSRTFSLALLDIDYEEVPVENLNRIVFHTKFCLDIDFLIQAVKDAEIYSDVFSIKSIQGQGLEFYSIGSIGEMRYKISPEDIPNLDLEIIQESCDSFAIDFLKKITKIHTIADTIDISLRTDHPLKMKISILEGGELLYYQAPRAENDDNGNSGNENDE